MADRKPMSFGKMPLRERVIRLFGGVPAPEAERRARRAYEAGMEDGNDEPVLYTADGKPIGTGYVETGSKPRDLSRISQEKAIEACYRLWQTHPLAKALVEIWVDYTVGDGVTVIADNPDVQAALDRFWFDSVNALGDKEGGVGEGLEELSRELWLFGEQVILTFERTGEDKGAVADGLVRLGSVDPTNIYAVITDKSNVRDELGLRLKSPTGGGDGPLYKIIRQESTSGLMEGRLDLRKYADLVSGDGRLFESRWSEYVSRLGELHRRLSGREFRVDGLENGLMELREAENSLSESEVKGNCFYFRVNKVSTGVRGRPELLPMIDWLDRFDQVFFDGAEHVALLNMFSWDLEIEGGSETAPEPERNLRKQAQKVAAMKPGSVYAHNEKTELEAKNPDLKTAELEVLIRQLRVFIAGGARVPEHFIAEGGYTNRATAESMGQPTMKMLAHKQTVIKRILATLCRYQIDVLVALGLLDREVDILDEDGQPGGKTAPAREAFRVVMPDISQKDTNLAANSLALVAQALLPLVMGNIIPRQPALEALAEIFQLLGVTLDVQDILDEESGNTGAVDPTVVDLLSKVDKLIKNPGGKIADGKPEPEPAPAILPPA